MIFLSTTSVRLRGLGLSDEVRGRTYRWFQVEPTLNHQGFGILLQTRSRVDKYNLSPAYLECRWLQSLDAIWEDRGTGQPLGLGSLHQLDTIDIQDDLASWSRSCVQTPHCLSVHSQETST